MINSPKLIIHGGAGSLEGKFNKEIDIRNSLKQICKKTWIYLEEHTALESVLFAVDLLESDPLFNAGTGSKLQNDGRIRMSAGLMDGERQKFSAIVNIQNVEHPIEIASYILNEKHTMIAGDKATEFSRKNGFPQYNPLIEKRWEEFLKKEKGETGTVGAVILDANGKIAAGTSTGGIGGETPGRMSDSATVAGNYANAFAGVSATGIGEEIVNDGVAVKIVTRVTDGLSLKDAVIKTINEAKERKHRYGVICLSNKGEIEVDKTTDSIFYASHDGTSIKTF